jgi:hypothetical protein
MKKSRRDFLDVYKPIRKQMARPEKVIPNVKDLQKNTKFDWRRELEAEAEEKEAEADEKFWDDLYRDPDE